MNTAHAKLPPHPCGKCGSVLVAARRRYCVVCSAEVRRVQQLAVARNAYRKRRRSSQGEKEQAA